MVNLTCNHRTVRVLKQPGCCILIQPLNSALVATLRGGRVKLAHGQARSARGRRTTKDFFQFGDQDMNRHGAKSAYDGYQWLSMVINGYQWLSMVINGYQWLSMVINGYQWLLNNGHSHL